MQRYHHRLCQCCRPHPRRQTRKSNPMTPRRRQTVQAYSMFTKFLLVWKSEANLATCQNYKAARPNPHQHPPFSYKIKLRRSIVGLQVVLRIKMVVLFILLVPPSPKYGPLFHLVCLQNHNKMRLRSHCWRLHTKTCDPSFPHLHARNCDSMRSSGMRIFAELHIATFQVNVEISGVDSVMLPPQAFGLGPSWMSSRVGSDGWWGVFRTMM